MIDINKKYETVRGDKVTLTSICEQDKEIVGFIENCFVPYYWNLEGKLLNGATTLCDLVELKD